MRGCSIGGPLTHDAGSKRPTIQQDTHRVDVIREFGLLFLVDGVANVRIGAMYCDLSGSGRQERLLGLTPELHVELHASRRGQLSSQYNQWRCAYLDPVVELDLSTRVHADMLQDLSRSIVRLSGRLQRLQNALLVDPPGSVGRYVTARKR